MCDRKIVGVIRSWQVFSALPKTVFGLEHIAVIDPRLETTEPIQVYALTMTQEEFNKLTESAFTAPVAAE